MKGWVLIMLRFQYAFQHLPFALNLCVVEQEESLKREFLKNIWIILTSPSWNWSHIQLHPHWQRWWEPTGQDGEEKKWKFIPLCTTRSLVL